MSTYEWITTLLVPVTNLITWLATRRKRRNDALGEMQGTIDMLVLKNNEIYTELITTRRDLADARNKIDVLESNQKKLMKENAELRSLIEKKNK